MTGTVFDIKEMAVHDGPGIRTTVFLKGCPLRCIWCHNPEGLTFQPQLMFKEVRCTGCRRCFAQCNHPDCRKFGRCLHVCPQNCLEVTGRSVEVDELTKELLASAEILGDSFGGFTFSGGEPLFQHEFLLELMKKLKPHHLCVETSGFADPAIFSNVLAELDFVIMDIKLSESALHKKYTGLGNELILKNFRTLKKCGKPYVVRTPLIPNITDTPENLAAIEEIIGDSPWEKLPYNAAAGAKYKMLSMKFKMEGQ